MRAQLALPLPGSSLYWCRVRREDSLCAELADGHYSRQTVGADGFLASGKCVVLYHPGPRIQGRLRAAAWGVVLNLDPVGALRWRNSIFRNTSSTPSSLLIEDATVSTYREWRATYGALPPVPLTTEIDIEATRARRSKRHEPGHCYRVAGWREVRRRGREHGRPACVVLEAPR